MLTLFFSATDPAERIYAFECVGWMAFNCKNEKTDFNYCL